MTNAVISPEVESIPLNKIIVDPYFVPEAQNIKDVVEASEEKIRAYQKILENYDFVEYIRVWKDGDAYFLVDGFEMFEAHRRYSCQNPSELVECLVLKCESREAVKSFSLRISSLLESQTEDWVRLTLNIRSLFPPSQNEEGSSRDWDEVKLLYSNGTKLKEKYRLKLDRAYKLAKTNILYRRVFGITGTDSMAKPNLKMATLDFGFTVTKLLPVLHTFKEAHLEFDSKYADYLRKVEELPCSDKDRLLPVHKRSGYIKERVVDIALAAAAKTNNPYFLGAADDDFPWTIVKEQATGQLSIPAYSFNTRSKNPEEVKKIYEAHYVSGRLYYALDSLLKRNSPAEHGKTIRVQDLDEDPFFNTYVNNIEFESIEYFHEIRKFKGIPYAIFNRLLRSLKLSAKQDFDFDDAKSGSKTSYRDAYLCYRRWYETTFQNSMVFLGHFQRDKEHPHHKIYSTILAYLELQSQRPDAHLRNIYFKTFMLLVFSQVFSLWDSCEKYEEEIKKALFTAHREALGADINQIYKSLAKVRRAQKLRLQQNNSNPASTPASSSVTGNNNAGGFQTLANLIAAGSGPSVGNSSISATPAGVP